MNKAYNTIGGQRGRPLPRPQRWSLDVAAPGVAQSWQEPASRLVAVLRQVSDAVREAYGRPLIWRASEDGPDSWEDVDAVEKILRRSQSQERGQTGANGVVHGHLSEADPPLVDVVWGAAVDGRVLNCTVRFNPRGGAKSLARHEPDWLAALLGSTVDAAGGSAGRIVTSSWLKEDERRIRRGVAPEGQVPFWLGELTFLPTPVDSAALPDTVVAHPCSTAQGTGAVAMLADLSATVTDPVGAVDDMLALRPYLP